MYAIMLFTLLLNTPHYDYDIYTSDLVIYRYEVYILSTQPPHIYIIALLH